ncbi:conserved Plasmodium protein, unknown function [Plasmodium knowlesi strain H]|uniref:Poly(A) RNA polymerase mitochondrial-like central palm domain-containing protein n=3 Tax=Plasmodium knowlesi TaxID=5850 RepID=A0A5K1TX93_PLAKH|nr:uncharacterized protein PKNH_0815600 [Plasmodium knowlesi strain H]OTN66054.1 Uncharacterized protein PKNOH_S100043600 [Plasmodium knowlesi]CAA9987799.1 nucleotidyltransferase, putative [Plasmodium knowlesi strain H]SBO22417.1 conserved Plasmodium protein, unknown function [Plasmodium knowlesi strain H]SBO29530.1 conserved Plasmodium protein, unknown function [Plasmodium knowlesi strain H]VVS77273.1 nucleotidyltransferase, putative [Plasmodium knowlesi strain H]|eukprot:XP_002258796.1 [Plasmodium knowlesi strain H]
MPIYFFHPVSNNLQRIYKVRCRRFHSFCELGTSEQNRRGDGGICQVDKKIQLTNVKLADALHDYISSDDSDGEESPQGKEEVCRSAQRYNGGELQNGVEKGDGHKDYPDNCAEAKSSFNSGRTKWGCPGAGENHSNNLDEVEKKHAKTLSDATGSGSIMQGGFSAELGATTGKGKQCCDMQHAEMKSYLNWYIRREREGECGERSPPPGEYPPSALDAELNKLEIALRPSQNDVNSIKTFLAFLQKEINKHYKNCHVTPFGSIINGFWTRNSDIDICIQIPILLSRKDQITFLKKICLILNNFNDGIIEQRFSAKVPIIHFYCKSLRHSFELSCDISVNNILAVINSKLIQKYVSIDRRLQLMGIALKYWSKSRNINDRSKGFLSSFSLILMIIHFLQYVAEPKILTSIQDISFKRNEKPFYVMGVDCKFCQDENVIREELRRINNYNDVYVDTSTLLIEFFKFFGYKYKSGIIAIRDINDYYQNFQAVRSYESYFLFVDNPFEVGKNVANVLPQNYKTIVNEMKRAYKILKNNGSWRDVCGGDHVLV